MSVVEVRVPDLEDFDTVEVIEALVQPGDKITAGDSLVTVESDKAAMERRATHALRARRAPHALCAGGARSAP